TSLINYQFKGLFYELPKITKSDLERVWSGDAKGIVKDKFTDLTTLKPDDVGYVYVQTDLQNNPVKRLQIYYRDKSGNFDNKSQSYDLANIYRLEFENGAIFKARKDSEMILKSLIEIAKNKQYNQKEGTTKVKQLLSNKYNLVDGSKSNTYKMMTNMMESKFYDMMNRSNTKIGGVDLNKAVRFINSTSAFLDLSLNIASGTANVINANAQLFLESFLKGQFIKASSIKKAEKIYLNDMHKIVGDLTRPVNHSFVNQLMEYFDTRGNLRLNNTNFIQTDLLKKGMDLHALQVFHQSGEHWVQSIVIMSVLDSIKVLNSDNKFINKKGEVVDSENKAASILDMLSLNKDNDVLELNENVVYTTHSRLTEWNKGGKVNVDTLIRKKLYDTLGNYTETDQPDLMRNWWGKLLMLYRRYLIPMGISRFRGIEYSFKDKSALTPDEMRFSYALQEYEEGLYTSLIRHSVSTLKNMKMYLLSKDNNNKYDGWSSLSDYEKHNIKRAVTEIVLTSAILPLLT
ncbi:MAG TPA: hypothetical protein PLV83_06390, partial [Bacilli bacterium]|nr:hypothetical protein [Bacilli bacterium]